MNLEVSVNVLSTKEKVWSVLTDIDHSSKTISGIEKTEILNKPETGIVGLKWQETRTMFGKEATEVMWITEAEKNHYYKTRAESHGAVYISTMRVEDNGDNCKLSMKFESLPVTIGAKVGNILFGRMMKNSTKKAMIVDLNDIKRTVENDIK